MGGRQQIQEIPEAVRLTLEKARADFAPVVRKVRWGDGPVYVCGAGDCAALGWAASYAFESFVGLPVVMRPVEIFQNYGLSLLRPRSVLIMISASGEWPEGQELALSARERGVTLVALTHSPEGSLVKLVDQVILSPAGGDAESPAAAVGMHAAVNFLAFETMRVLKKPKPWWDPIEREFDQLGSKLDWAFTQFSPVVRSAAAEMVNFPRLCIVGGGFNHYPAWRAARRMRSPAGLLITAMEASEYLNAGAPSTPPDDAVLLLSGSNSKVKKLLHRCSAQARRHGARVLSLTDSNDAELVANSDLGILIPLMLEAPASTLMMFMLEWLALEAQAGRAERRIR